MPQSYPWWVWVILILALGGLCFLYWWQKKNQG